MKNTKEIKAILTAIFAINKTSEREDKDISKILDYAFRFLPLKVSGMTTFSSFPLYPVRRYPSCRQKPFS